MGSDAAARPHGLHDAALGQAETIGCNYGGRTPCKYVASVSVSVSFFSPPVCFSLLVSLFFFLFPFFHPVVSSVLIRHDVVVSSASRSLTAQGGV